VAPVELAEAAPRALLDRLSGRGAAREPGQGDRQQREAGRFRDALEGDLADEGP
jgi:hypothetical protein